MLPAEVPAEISLPMLVDRAARTLASAKTAAEVLVAAVMAGVAYDAAKRAARLTKAKGAYNELMGKVTRAQADALDIEAQAKRRIADEYDAAQERGEVAKIGDNLPRIPIGNSKPTAADLGLSLKVIHEAREIRDAEEADPGIVRRVLDEAIEAGEEPTRAKVKRAVKAKSKRAKRHPRPVLNSPTETQHDRDLRALLGVWESTCESAREAFLTIIRQ